MVAHVSGAQRYEEISVLTASPLQLTIMLHEGAIQALGEAVDHLEKPDVPRRTQAVRRALGMVAELQGSLDFEANAALAASLDRQYGYMAQRIFEGNLEQRAAPLLEVVALLTTLRAGWLDLANQPRGV
jgi:flagellar protein FliS